MGFYRTPGGGTQDLTAIALAGRGLKAESFPIMAMSGTLAALTGGTVYYMALEQAVRAGETYTGVVVWITAAGVALTGSKVALARPNGGDADRVAVSADQGVSWETTGPKLAPFTSAYVATATEMMYAACWVTGGTIPGMARNGANAIMSAQVGANPRPFGQLAGQVDIPATATLTAGTGLYIALY